MKKNNNPVHTILTLTVACLGLYLWLDMTWLLYTATILGLVGVFSPWLSSVVEFGWMKLAWVLSLLVPNIILTIIFYFLLFPVAILARIFRKDDPLTLKDTGISTFKKMEDSFTQAFFEKPW